MDSTLPDLCPRYRPRAPTNPLKEIVEDHLEELLEVYDERFFSTYGPLHPRVGELSRVAYAATRKFFTAQFPAIEGAVPGMIVAPQSFGNLLNPHAHLHSVSSLGVFDSEGTFRS